MQAKTTSSKVWTVGTEEGETDWFNVVALLPFQVKRGKTVPQREARGANRRSGRWMPKLNFGIRGLKERDGMWGQGRRARGRRVWLEEPGSLRGAASVGGERQNRSGRLPPPGG